MNRNQQQNGDHNHIPVPQEYKKNGLPGFPGSSYLPKKKGARESWDLGKTHPGGKEGKTVPKGWWGEWDSQHGEIEVYNKQGEHQGAWDPKTGEEIPGKQKDSRKPTYYTSSTDPNDQSFNRVVTYNSWSGTYSGLDGNSNLNLSPNITTGTTIGLGGGFVIVVAILLSPIGL